MPCCSAAVAWYLMSTHPGHLVLLPMAVLAVTALVSYERAKAESLGVAVAKGGLMERAERMIVLGIGFLSAALLVPVLWVMLVLTSLTAAGRFARVWRAAEAPARPARLASDRRARRLGAERRARGRRTARRPSRWRQRRRGELASRSGRTWRARRDGQGLRRRAGSRRSG